MKTLDIIRYSITGLIYLSFYTWAVLSNLIASNLGIIAIALMTLSIPFVILLNILLK